MIAGPADNTALTPAGATTPKGTEHGTDLLIVMAIVAALLLGSALRLIWGGDIEYKVDEAYTFAAVQRVLVGGEPLPAVGMPSSTGLRNPGLSVWIFVALARLFSIRTPVDLARAVQVLNVGALALVIFVALRVVPRREREPWLWATVLAAVNPVAVLLHRKIWAQSVLPFFSVLLLIGWFRRHTRVGAFAWGFLGMFLGQIHLSGFFFSAGLALWALLFERRRRDNDAGGENQLRTGRVQWGWWVAGSVLGALPIIPWLLHVLGTERGVAGHGFDPMKLLTFRFWFYWTIEPLGLYVYHSLGRVHLSLFAASPLIGGRPTYLAGLCFALVVGVGVWLLLRGMAALWRARADWQTLLVGTSSQTAFTQNATLWGYGALLTLLTPAVYQHYLPIAFPLPQVWLARVALATNPRSGRWLIGALCAGQAVLTLLFLYYIHVHGGAPGADYGIAYMHQTTPPTPYPAP